MKRSRFTETQIISILKEAYSAMKIKVVCRRHGISDTTYYSGKSKYGGSFTAGCVAQTATDRCMGAAGRAVPYPPRDSLQDRREAEEIVGEVPVERRHGTAPGLFAVQADGRL